MPKKKTTKKTKKRTKGEKSIKISLLLILFTTSQLAATESTYATSADQN
jgi:hypothetical protein